MLNDIVADHEIETAGREPMGLDVAENGLLRIVVVADLVLVDIDHRDMGAPQYVKRQEAGRATAGLVDRKAGRRQLGVENAVNGEQAPACLAGRQVEQRLRMRSRRRRAVNRRARIGGCIGKRRMGEIDRDCVIHWAPIQYRCWQIWS